MKLNKKLMSLVLSSIVGLSMIGCSNDNTNKVEYQESQVQEEQVKNIDLDKAYDIAKEVIGEKYNSIIGSSLIKNENKIEFMLVGESFRFMNLNDNEELKNNLIDDYQEITNLYEENEINADFIVNIKAYPSKIVCFSIDENGIISDNLNSDFISNKDNWE